MTRWNDTALTSPYWLPLGGFLIGITFGAVVRVANYCAVGAITDWRISGDLTRLGAAALAASVAIIGAQTLDWAHVTDLSRSIYLAPRINLLNAIAGGLLFGFGMVHAGGCPSRALVRAGGGDLRALVVLLAMAVAALACLSGILGSTRVAIDGTTAIDLAPRGLGTQSATEILGKLGIGGGRLTAIALVAGPLLAFAAFAGKVFRSPLHTFGGVGVGGLAILAWALTGMAYDEMAANPTAPASLSFVKPVADAIDWIERSTALGLPGFAASSVFGVIAGSFLTAILQKNFRYAGFVDRADLTRHIGGAVAMGIGGILALGCSIGQGVTGLSTLAVQSVVAVAAIIAGAVIAIERLQEKI